MPPVYPIDPLTCKFPFSVNRGVVSVELPVTSAVSDPLTAADNEPSVDTETSPDATTETAPGVATVAFPEASTVNENPDFNDKPSWKAEGGLGTRSDCRKGIFSRTLAELTVCR